MNTNQQQKKQEAENFKVEERNERQQQPIQESSSSTSNSPSHEFSFTISLHSDNKSKSKSKSTPPSFAIDLSPADEIFFHGHLLPLHLLSHLPSSPRSSINSVDSFTIPIKDIWDSENPIKDTSSCSTSSTKNNETEHTETSGRIKSKPFSFFGFAKWRKGCEVTEQDDKAKHKRRLGFEVSQILKRYAKVVRPLFFRWRKENLHIRRQAYSFSGNLNPRNKQELRGRRGEISAPASMRTSPTNSGLLVATPSSASSSTSDSTMEELQSAIQAAIAHCKNSIAKEDKINVKS